jgi:hypothetical protein
MRYLKELMKNHKILFSIEDVPYGIRTGQLWNEIPNLYRFRQFAAEGDKRKQRNEKKKVTRWLAGRRL